MAKRYSQEEKDAVVEFVKEYNQSNGRGGQSAAKKKFDINPITIKSWLDKAGVKSPGKKGRKKVGRKPGPKPGRKPGRKPAAVGGSLSASLTRMAQIQDEITALQSEYESLKAKI